MAGSWTNKRLPLNHSNGRSRVLQRFGFSFGAMDHDDIQARGSIKLIPQERLGALHRVSTPSYGLLIPIASNCNVSCKKRSEVVSLTCFVQSYLCLIVLVVSEDFVLVRISFVVLYYITCKYNMVYSFGLKQQTVTTFLFTVHVSQSENILAFPCALLSNFPFFLRN